MRAGRIPAELMFGRLIIKSKLPILFLKAHRKVGKEARQTHKEQSHTLKATQTLSKAIRRRKEKWGTRLCCRRRRQPQRHIRTETPRQ